ncbi:MAG: hypothetical protein L0Y44_16695 [Phycisphaerales bacterium]|nr:hypothetical protein [Phycisphaerales bacterium]
MNARTIWTIIFIFGAVALLVRGVMTGAGSAYVRSTEVQGKVQTGESPISWMVYTAADPREQSEPAVSYSLPRTVGVWVAALLTLCILSFLWGDNPFYKFAESVVVGASAAYVMVAGFWSTIVSNLLGKLTPAFVRGWAVPGMSKPEDIPWWSDEGNWYIVPLALSIMLLWRLSPKGAWIARWPLAFFIGATAGFRLVGFLGPDFVSQIGNTIIPMYVKMPDGGFDLWPTVRNIVTVIGVLACLVYFFFSFEHKGVVGRTARLGIWFLMITFGAGFGYTVMGRIALLAERLQFLFDDWLWIIDPTGKRAIEAASAATGWLQPLAWTC